MYGGLTRLVTIYNIFIKHLYVWLIINTFAHNSKIKIMKKGIDINRIISLYEEVKHFLDWLYQDSTVYMQRKYFKYKLISSL